MKLLAFDTSTDALSVAVAREQGGGQAWQHNGPGGALASGSLIPAILSLLDQAGLRLSELDAIVFGAGPGSFTGLRTACSVAQGLALGAGVKVLPIASLLAVAESARQQQAEPESPLQVVAVLDARMSELYVAHYQYGQGQWTELQGAELIAPEQLRVPAGAVLAGNAFAAYAGRWTQETAAAPQVFALPGAQALLQLAPVLLAAGGLLEPEQAFPHYIRDKVAQTTVERAAEKAAVVR